MTQSLDYARPTARRPSRVLAYFAHATLAYPLFLLASLYGQWLLSWYVLGHQPQPSLDDPKSIDGASWMHGITYIAIMGFLPAAGVALALNILYAVDRRLRWVGLAIRAVSLLALWVGTFVVLNVDPGMVLYWWFD